MRACKQKIECDICVTSLCGVDLIVHCFWGPAVSVVLFPSLNSFAELGLRGMHSVSNLILLLRVGGQRDAAGELGEILLFVGGLKSA